MNKNSSCETSVKPVVVLSVIALLAAGATLPIFVFNHQAFSLTRRRKHTDK